MLDFLKPKRRPFLTPQQEAGIVAAVERAELQTSGEVRVFVESHCRFVDAIDRAAEVFQHLGMEKTAARNAVLVYVAVADRQAAIYGDEGIHAKVGTAFWKEEVAKMLMHFREQHIPEGIVAVIDDIGEALKLHFPYDKATDTNELPNEIVFGD